MANKRIRSRRPGAKEVLLAGLDLPKAESPRRSRRRASEIEEEIHRLECVIAAAPSLQKHQALRRRDTLPPPDDHLPASRRRTGRPAAALPLNARRIRSQQRLMQCVQLGLIVVAIAAMAGWMRQWFQW